MELSDESDIDDLIDGAHASCATHLSVAVMPC